MEELIKLKKEFRDHIYNSYVKHKDIYSKIANETENKIDKMIISLSTGAILLTFSFFDTITSNIITQDYVNLIKFSRIFFMISISVTLVGNRLSAYLILNLTKELDKFYKKRDNEIVNNKNPDQTEFPTKKHKNISKIISYLNIMAFLSIIIGLFLIIRFAWLSF